MSEIEKKCPIFSILVVSLNPGDKLLATIQSIEKQSFTDYEVIVKDGGSKDTSLEQLREYLESKKELAERIRIVEEKDSSIYDGMNQAVKYAAGEFYYFLNCGDNFASHQVLELVNKAITEDSDKKALIYYGNIFDELRKQVVPSNTQIDDFACYRNVPCHQACIYHYSLFEERGYKPEYRVRADYEHFLWSYFCKQANPTYMDVTMATYEGGGFSETKENRKKSAMEHREIVETYMERMQVFKYRTILMITLAPLRTKMAESKRMAGFYNGVKKIYYKMKK